MESNDFEIVYKWHGWLYNLLLTLKKSTQNWLRGMIRKIGLLWNYLLDDLFEKIGWLREGWCCRQISTICQSFQLHYSFHLWKFRDCALQLSVEGIIANVCADGFFQLLYIKKILCLIFYNLQICVLGVLGICFVK